MARPPLEVADILNAYGDAYIAHHRGHLSRVHASSLCVPKTSPQSALRSGPSLAQSEGSDSPDVSVTTPSIGPQTLMREPWARAGDVVSVTVAIARSPRWLRAG